MSKIRKIYLAGPMRGYPLCNFPAFDSYQKKLMDKGYLVTSPADIDRSQGFDPSKHEASSPGMLRKMITRDVEAICQVDAVAVMPGWRKSKGVRVEIAVANFLNLPVVAVTKLIKL